MIIAMAKSLIALASGGVSAYKQHNQNQANELKRKDNMKQERHNAAVKRLQSGDESAANLDMFSLKDRGLKDEFIMLSIFGPLYLLFHPDYAQYVKDGFEAMKSVPDYYWYVVAAIVIDTFGFRSMVRYLLEFHSAKFKGK